MTQPRSHIDVQKLLAQAGLPEDTVAATLAIDAIMMEWRRRAGRREVASVALRTLGIGLELLHFDVLLAVEGSIGGGAIGGEVTVGLVAERLGIDPSRASRLVGEMVTRGYVRRAVSQADARRAILALTRRGATVVQAVRAYKFIAMGDFFAGWSAEDLEHLTTLLPRLGQWLDRVEAAGQAHGAEVEHLARLVAAAEIDPKAAQS